MGTKDLGATSSSEKESSSTDEGDKDEETNSDRLDDSLSPSSANEASDQTCTERAAEEKGEHKVDLTADTLATSKTIEMQNAALKFSEKFGPIRAVNTDTQFRDVRARQVEAASVVETPPRQLDLVMVGLAIVALLVAWSAMLRSAELENEIELFRQQTAQAVATSANAAAAGTFMVEMLVW